MAKKKLEREEKLIETPELPKVASKKEEYLALYKQLQDLKITRLSDLENLIARTE